MEKIKLFLSLLMAMLLSVGNVWATDYQLVTSTSDLEAGANYVIGSAASGSGVFMATTSNTNNRKQTDAITITDGKIAATASVLVLQLGGSTGAWTFLTTNYEGTDGYLANADSGTGNNCKVGSTERPFTISFDGDKAVITATAGNERNIIRYNSGSTCFACYASGQKDVYLYKEVTGGGSDPGDEPGGDDPAPTGETYELVTNASDLAVDDEIIIVNIANLKALSTTQNNNNRGAAAVTITNDAIVPGDDVQIITLGQTNEHWTLYTGSGYLYASSSSSNQLKTQATNNANGEWTISISDGVASVVAQGTNSRNVMQYNSGSTIFACYGTASQAALAIFKKSDGTPQKQAAGLTYAAADQKKLNKLGDAFTAPTLQNPNNLSGITYASNNTTVAEVAANGAVTIKAAGVAVITASFVGNDDYKAGSASYTIGVTAHAGTEADPYVAADAKIAIDVKGTVENACATGIVCNITTTTLPQEGYITFYFSADGLTTGQQIEAYKCYGLNSAPFEAVTDVKTGATVVVTGTLKKYNSTYEFDQNCHLVSYEAPAVPKTHIANTKETAYTVAQAITYAAYGVTYDLDDYVYVQGVVKEVKSFNIGVMNIFIKDANADNEFELFKCAGINDGNATTPFAAVTDVQAGNIVIGYGQLTVYNNVYEFKQGNYLVDLQVPVTGIELDAIAEVEEGEEVNLTATILPSNATGTIVWTVESGDAYASVDGGVVTGIAEGEAVIRATVQGTEIYAECTVTVSAGAPVPTDYYEKVTETADITDGTYLIVYEAGNVAFNGGVETLDDVSNTIEVAITNDNKIGVTTATEAATFFIDVTAGSIQSASGKYIGVTSNSNGLKTSDEAKAYSHNFSIDNDGNAVIAAAFEGSTMSLRYNTASNQARFRYYKDNGQQPIQLYKLANETVKANPELVWNPESVELTVGGEFTSPTLSHATGITGTVTYTSDKETVATVNANGVISLVADATGTAHITASYAGDENFKAGSAVCTIKVNPAHSIYVSPSLTVNFGSVAQNATVEDKVITVTLTGVDAATATLGGTNPEVFSFTPAALTASGDITLSASSATVGTFNATLTISDDAGLATSRVVTLKLTVTDSATEETPISTTSEWVEATEIADGMQVLITGVKDNVTYAMGEQKSTNRAAYVATVDGEGVLTPGEGTMAFTLVAQGDGTYAIRTSNGKYLYAAASGSNHLKTKDEVDVNAKWTLTVASAVAESSTNRNVMQFNGSGENKLFSCYASANQTAIQLYVPYVVPAPTYTITYAAGEGSGDAPEAFTKEEGETFTVAAANTFTAPEGKEFDMWNDGTNDYAPGATYTVGTSNVTLTAQWKDIETPVEPEWTEVRTGLEPGRFYTICMNKNILAISGASFWGISKRDGGNTVAYLEEEGAPYAAGKPFVFYATATTLEVVYGNETTTDSIANGALRGTLNGMNAAALEEAKAAAGIGGIYLMYQNALHPLGTNNHLDANRAYLLYDELEIVINEPTPAPGRQVRKMPMQGNVATGIDEIFQMSNGNENPRKVMIDGQLLIIRDGKLYDTTGRLVK